jgi:hypothetical protein
LGTNVEGRTDTEIEREGWKEGEREVRERERKKREEWSPQRIKISTAGRR